MINSYTEQEIEEFYACKSYEEFAALQKAKREKKKAESWRVVRRSEKRRDFLWFYNHAQFLDLERPDGKIVFRHAYETTVGDPCNGISVVINFGDEDEMRAEFMTLSGWDRDALNKWKKEKATRDIGAGPDTYEAHI